ncbi:MAG: elongation factor P [Acidobacteria bacterium]|nr:elongation factor P [Acidobacteriota bacterium]MBK9707826.1 elongation factor P [Acidobacteriota bacterium]
MALIGANELKKKMLITVEGQPYTVVEVFFASPTARGASTMVRTKLRNLLTESVLEKSFKTSEKFEEPDVELTPASFLYSDGDGYHFMDESTYEQFHLNEDQLGEERFYLKDGLILQIRKYNGDPIAIELPSTVDLIISETEPGVRGDSASGGTTKVATLETGLQIRVPLFIKEGELVRINTQTGEFLSRARE